MNAATLKTGTDNRGLISPYDTVASASTRFVLELVAWTAGPLAVYRASGSLPLAGLTLAGLLALPALFNTPGDKHKAPPINTPGPVRLALELLLWGVAVGAAALVWPTPVAVAVAVVAIGATVAGTPRAFWLLRGAPLPSR